MMSATDELRRMLDERGVEWWAEDDPEEPAYYFVTKWFANGCEQTYEEIPAIRSRTLDAHRVTPNQAIAATMGEPPYDELLRCLENDWNISASWDGLRKFWNIELTEDGVRMRDSAWAERTCRFVSSKGPDRPPVCDACGYELGIYDCEWFEDGTYGYNGNYCPNCGARVIGG